VVVKKTEVGLGEAVTWEALMEMVASGERPVLLEELMDAATTREALTEAGDGVVPGVGLSVKQGP
jgi:hypothetical protein